MSQQINQTNTDNQEIEIDLLDLLGFYMSKLPYLILALVIGAACAGIFTKTMIPNKYTATSRMYMVSASSDSVVNLSDLNLGTSISSDYVELMMSRPVIEGVIRKLGLDFTYEQLSSMISLSVVNNTRIVKIAATTLDPQLSMDIANQLARTARQQLPRVMEAPTPSIAEEAVLPTKKSSPSLTRNALIGGLLALVVVLAILTIIYMMDDTLKTSEDVEKMFGVMPLSVIPEGEIAGLKKDSDSGRHRRHRKKKKSKKSSAGSVAT